MRDRILILIAAVLLLSILSGCDDPTAGALVYVTVGDAAHDGPDPRFYLLPPIVEEPVYSGDFDDSLAPVVEIPAMGVTFTSVVNPGSDYIRVDADEELYIVNWKTGVSDFEPGGVYRISFKLPDEEVGYTEIGYVEIRVYENIGDVVLTGDEIPTGLNPGRTLPIKFRIEK